MAWGPGLWVEPMGASPEGPSSPACRPLPCFSSPDPRPPSPGGLRPGRVCALGHSPGEEQRRQGEWIQAAGGEGRAPFPGSLGSHRGGRGRLVGLLPAPASPGVGGTC